jgi:hypothetical protein
MNWPSGPAVARPTAAWRSGRVWSSVLSRPCRDLLLRLGRILGRDHGLELGPLQLLVEIEQLQCCLAPGRRRIGKRRLRLDDCLLIVEVRNAEA